MEQRKQERRVQVQECCDDGPMEVWCRGTLASICGIRKRIIRTGECFWEERRHAQKEPRLGERGIRLEGGKHSEQKEARVQHIMPRNLVDIRD